MVQEFRERGYLNEALLNFIALLGWALDDKTEFFTMDELITHFTIERINRASAVFSYEKLDWFNGMYIRKQSITALYEQLLPYLRRGSIVTTENEAQRRDEKEELEVINTLSLLKVEYDGGYQPSYGKFEVTPSQIHTPNRLEAYHVYLDTEQSVRANEELE